MSSNSGLSKWLDDKVRDGEAILFLGAGASRGAVGPKGVTTLNGLQLRDHLSEKFLNGEMKDRPLSEVAELAKAESSLFEVQREIKNLFEPLNPAAFHLLIPAFRWYAIVTTNYDLVIERAYAQASGPLQQAEAIMRDGDRFQSVLRDPTAVPYLKLHGCVSQISAPELPLILASEEYAKHRHGRGRLFDHLQDWGRENPIIFCGYNISDPNIQQILFQLADKSINRPPYATVNPGLSDIEARYWQRNNFIPIRKTFEQFLTDLDSSIPPVGRQLSILRTRDASSVQKWIVRGKPSDALLLSLQQTVDHVHPGMPVGGVDARDFYRGQTINWSPIIQSLDVPRRVADDLELEAILEKPKANVPQLFVVKGHAGSGKSVVLRRFAWNAAATHNSLVFWLREGGTLREDLIRELHVITDERIVIVIDDALSHLDQLNNLLSHAEREELPITFVVGARTNEWNVAAGDIEAKVTASYELRDLSDREIDHLLEKLHQHNCDALLARLDTERQRDLFKLTADRQLLVALHEALEGGEPFHKIVVDEYNRLVPTDARVLYLDVCTLHRFRVGVRAGLISRVSGITFTQFEKALLKPLEHVVMVYRDESTRDFAYRTRHQLIADIVFRTVLSDPEKRAEQIIRIVKSMNVDYESDGTAFSELIRGRELADLFSDRVHADRVFEAALTAKASISHIEHQRAIFELRHPGGSIVSASRAIDRAIAALEYPSNSINHTKALVLGRMALVAGSKIEREKHRSEARDILKRQIKKGITPHASHALGEIIMDELKERAESAGTSGTAEDIESRVVSDLVAEIEEVIVNGLQRFPGEPYLHELEAKLARLVRDEPRALRAMETAFSKSRGSGYLAVRLADFYASADDKQRAREILQQCLDSNPTARPAHLELAKLLIDDGEEKHFEPIRRHLRSSFTEGDTNYDAQFRYARHEFLYGRRDTAELLFKTLRKSRASPEARDRIRGEIKEVDGSPKRFDGTVTAVHDSYAFIRVPQLNTEVFVYHGNFAKGEWLRVRVGARAKLKVAFTFRGIAGTDVSVS